MLVDVITAATRKVTGELSLVLRNNPEVPRIVGPACPPAMPRYATPALEKSHPALFATLLNIVVPFVSPRVISAYTAADPDDVNRVVPELNVAAPVTASVDCNTVAPDAVNVATLRELMTDAPCNATAPVAVMVATFNDVMVADAMVEPKVTTPVSVVAPVIAAVPPTVRFPESARFVAASVVP